MTNDNALVMDQRHGDFLRAAAPAGASFRALLASVDELARASSCRASRLLLDLSAAGPGMVEQAILCEHMARQLGHAGKVASLVPEGLESGIPERVARSLGLDLQVFTSEEEAVGWLTA